jgi:hypothetical protein
VLGVAWEEMVLTLRDGYDPAVYALNMRKSRQFINPKCTSDRNQLILTHGLHHIGDFAKNAIDRNEWSIFATRPSDGRRADDEWLPHLITLRSATKMKA